MPQYCVLLSAIVDAHRPCVVIVEIIVPHSPCRVCTAAACPAGSGGRPARRCLERDPRVSAPPIESKHEMHRSPQCPNASPDTHPATPAFASLPRVAAAPTTLSTSSATHPRLRPSPSSAATRRANTSSTGAPRTASECSQTWALRTTVGRTRAVGRRNGCASVSTSLYCPATSATRIATTAPALCQPSPCTTFNPRFPAAHAPPAHTRLLTYLPTCRCDLSRRGQGIGPECDGWSGVRRGLVVATTLCSLSWLLCSLYAPAAIGTRARLSPSHSHAQSSQGLTSDPSPSLSFIVTTITTATCTHHCSWPAVHGSVGCGVCWRIQGMDSGVGGEGQDTEGG